MTRPQIRIELDGVQETLLWPLYCRAAEAARPDTLLLDHKAIALRESIDYAFIERFGDPEIVFALRASCFDAEVSAFLAKHPRGTVVALGDGLETQFWRIDNGSATWVSVDLEDTTALRRRLLPDGERNRSIAHSALDLAWFDRIDPEHGVFITAQGLFMYLEGEEVLALIEACAHRFRGASLMFDAVPAWLTKSSKDGTRLSRIMMRGRKDDNSYRLPPMTWGTAVDTIRQQVHGCADVSTTELRKLPPGRGFAMGTLYPAVATLPVIRNICPSVVLVHFEP